MQQEQELLERVAGGDHQAFASLLLDFHPIAFRTAMRLTNDAWMAEDVVQEVFLKVWMKRSSLPAVHNFRAWLITITTHVIYDMLRKKNAEKNNLDVWLTESGPMKQLSEEADSDSSSLEELVNHAMTALSPKQRQAFSLIKKEGYSREEAARLMNISPETVKTHLQQAMRTIRAYCISRMGMDVLLIICSISQKKIF